MDRGYEIIEHLISVNGVWVDGKGNGGVVYTLYRRLHHFYFVASAKLVVVYTAWYLAGISKSWQ